MWAYVGYEGLQERHLCSRANFKLNRAAALAERRQLLTRIDLGCASNLMRVLISVTASLKDLLILRGVHAFIRSHNGNLLRGFSFDRLGLRYAYDHKAVKKFRKFCMRRSWHDCGNMLIGSDDHNTSRIPIDPAQIINVVTVLRVEDFFIVP